MEAAEKLLGRFITYIIDPAILLIFAAGFLYFIWGLVQFIRDLDEGAHREEGIQHMIWGIAGMVIMVSVWGIIALLDNTFNLHALDGSGPDTSSFETNYYDVVR